MENESVLYNGHDPVLSLTKNKQVEVAHIFNHFFLVETDKDSEKNTQFSTQLKATFTELGLGGL